MGNMILAHISEVFLYAEANGLLEGIFELVFCNDSCYPPLKPFSLVFSEMQKRECDFWGLTKNHEISPHIQSFFSLSPPGI